jgi:hypothetical protein
MLQMSATVMSKADTLANADTATLRTTEFRTRQFMWRSSRCARSAGRRRTSTVAAHLRVAHRHEHHSVTDDASITRKNVSRIRR